MMRHITFIITLLASFSIEAAQYFPGRAAAASGAVTFQQVDHDQATGFVATEHIPVRQAATDCTTETGGVTDEQCHEADDDTLYVCESGPCNGSGWVAYGGGAGGSWDGDITDIDLDGGTDIGADLVDADLILVDDGAGGTNRKAALSRVKAYIAPAIERWEVFVLSNTEDDPTTGEKYYYIAPAAGKIHDAYGHCISNSTGASTIMDVEDEGVSIFTNRITIETGEDNSGDATTQPSVTSSPRSISEGDELAFHIDQAPTSGCLMPTIHLLISWD